MYLDAELLENKKRLQRAKESYHLGDWVLAPTYPLEVGVNSIVGPIVEMTERFIVVLSEVSKTRTAYQWVDVAAWESTKFGHVNGVQIAEFLKNRKIRVCA